MAAPHGGAALIWRDYITDGVPASGVHKPDKAEIRDFLAWVSASNRPRLTGATTVNVSYASGDDGTGTVVDGAATGDPFATIEGAWAALAEYDLDWQNVTILVEASTSYGAVALDYPLLNGNKDTITILGDGATPADTLFTAASGNGFDFQNGVGVTLQNIRMTAPAGKNVSAILRSDIGIVDWDFGPCLKGLGLSGNNVYSSRSALVTVQMGGTVSGDFGVMFSASHSGDIRVQGTNVAATDVVTFSGTPSCNQFIYVDGLSEVVITNCSDGTGYWSGSLGGGNIGIVIAGMVQWATGTTWPVWPTGLTQSFSLRDGGQFVNAIKVAQVWDYSSAAAIGPVHWVERAGNGGAGSNLGAQYFTGDNDADQITIYGGRSAKVSADTDGAESGLMLDWTMRAGTLTTEATLGGGLLMAGATGGAKGVGTINATAVYDDNTLLSCFVFDAALDGRIDMKKWDALVPDRVWPVMEMLPTEVGTWIEDPDGAAIPRPIMRDMPVQVGERKERRRHDAARKFAARLGTDHDPLTVEGYTRHWREKRHLPAMPNEAKFDPTAGLEQGGWVQRLIETVETQAVLIGELHDRLKAMEAAR